MGSYERALSSYYLLTVIDPLDIVLVQEFLEKILKSKRCLIARSTDNNSAEANYASTMTRFTTGRFVLELLFHILSHLFSLPE